MSEITKYTTECIHHWIIEAPDGPISKGFCKYCGITAEFLNDLQGHFAHAEKTDNEERKKKSYLNDNDDILIHVS